MTDGKLVHLKLIGVLLNLTVLTVGCLPVTFYLPYWLRDLKQQLVDKRRFMGSSCSNRAVVPRQWTGATRRVF